MKVTETIKSAVDIVDLIGETVKLRRAGRTMLGFCPFHANTRTPAFTVFPDTQSFHCFGCKASGTVFDFVMRRDGLEFGEALRVLAERAGIVLEERTPQDDAADAHRERLYELLSGAARFWTHTLLASPRGGEARAYLEQRGITRESIEAFQLGFAPQERAATLSYLSERLGAKPAEAHAAGLAIEREQDGYFDRFRGRIMFPIHDPKGRIVGFGGRAMGANHPKYMNSPQSDVFDKGHLLYGLYQGRDSIRKADHVVVVEGYVDVIMAHQHGYRNVIAPMGTALTDSHAALLNRLTKRITLAMDGDAAGKTAALRGLDTLRENLDSNEVLVPTASGMLRWERELAAVVTIALLPAGQDPDDLIRAEPQAWERLIAQAQPLMDFYLGALTSGLNLQLAKDKATAVERLAPLVRQLSDPVEQAHYMQRLAALVGTPEAIVRAAVLPQAQRQPARGKRRGDPPPPPPTAEQILSAQERSTDREDYLLSLVLRHPHIHPGLEATLRDELAASPALRELWSGELGELFERVENRVLWEAWRAGGPHGPTNPQSWAATLAPPVQDHFQHLMAMKGGPSDREYKASVEADECVRVLRRRLAQRWTERIGQLITTAEPDHQHLLLEQLMALQLYLRTSSVPRRSTYFHDSRDSLKF